MIAVGGPGRRGEPAPRLARFEPVVAWDPSFLEGAREGASVADAAMRFRGFDRWPTVPEIDAILHELAGVRFEEQPPKKKKRRRRAVPVDADSLYDGRITLDGVVPTRACSWHDLMNALVWASFPAAKRAVHARQYAAASRRIGAPRHRLPGARTPEEDSLTMLDEGGEVWLVVDGRTAREWEAEPPEALVEGEASGRLARVVFGHALLEHAIAGCRSARPRRLFLRVDALPAEARELRARADLALAGYLAAGGV